jgi:hypothetical protein
MNNLNKTIDLEPYKTFFHRLRSESLRRIIRDRSTALKYARKGIKRMEPNKLNDEYVESVAEDMRRVAKMTLEKRAKKA